MHHNSCYYQSVRRKGLFCLWFQNIHLMAFWNWFYDTILLGIICHVHFMTCSTEDVVIVSICLLRAPAQWYYFLLWGPTCYGYKICRSDRVLYPTLIHGEVLSLNATWYACLVAIHGRPVLLWIEKGRVNWERKREVRMDGGGEGIGSCDQNIKSINQSINKYFK